MSTPAKRRHPRATSNVKAACQACRASKTKCDGVRPTCSRCAHRSTPCTYDTEPDEFRITALKRKYAEVQRESSSRERLLRLLLEGTHEGSIAILRRMRSKETDDAILTALDVSVFSPEDPMDVVEEQPGVEHNDTLGQDQLPPPPPVPTIVHGRPDNRLSIAFLVDRQAGPRTMSEGAESRSATPRPGAVQRTFEKRRRLSDVLPEMLRPIYQTSISAPTIAVQMLNKIEPLVPKPIATDYSWMHGLGEIRAADWQVGYASDLSFLEMINCYFAWENSVMGLVHEEAFWEGLKAGGSEFCNMCLVHSIIALGSKIYGMSHPEGIPSLDRQALNEATGLWDIEPRAATPANISAGFVIHATFASNGQDEIGAPFLAESMEMVMQSGLFTEEDAAQDQVVPKSKKARQRAEFAWAVYAHHGYRKPGVLRRRAMNADFVRHHTLSFNSSPALKNQPLVAIPAISEPDDRRHWIPFPFTTPEPPSMSSSKAHARASLWRLGNLILPLHRKYLSNPLDDGYWNEALRLHSKFEQWHMNLSPRLNILHAAPPHVLWLQSALPLSSTATHLANATSSTDYHRCVLDIYRPFIAARKNILLPPFEPAHRHSLASHAQLRLLTHQVEIQYPRMPIAISALVTPMLIICNDTLPHALGRGDASDECFYFCLCLRLMYRMVGAYPLMALLMRGLQQVAARKGVGLPLEATKIFKSLERDRMPDVVVRSAFPVDLDLMATDLQASQLQSLVDEAGQLSIT